MPAVMRAREKLANVLAWAPMRWDAAGGRGGQGGERLFFALGCFLAALAHFPGRMLLGRALGALRAWVALSSRLVHSCLPCCCSPLAPALRAALGAEATSGLAPPFPRRAKTLSLACSPPRGPRDTDVQFAHLEY